MLKYILALLIAVVFSAVLYYRTKPELSISKKLLLFGLRTLTVTVIILFLLTPIIYFIRKYYPKPTVILLRDVSQSMHNVADKISKAQAEESIFARYKSAYSKAGYDVKDYEFADGLKGKASATYLTPTLEKVLSLNTGVQIQSIVLFSDGWFRDQSLSYVKNLEIPLTTIGDTISSNKYDIEVSDIRHNRQSYRNEVSLFEADLKATAYSGTAKAVFYVDGKPVNSKTVSFGKDPVQTVSFDYRFTKTGLSRVDIKISADKNETNLANNQYPGAIEILNDKELLVVLTDKPNWDGKFILDTIQENTRWQSQSFIHRSSALYQGDKQVNFTDWGKVSVFVIINQGNLSLDSNLAKAIQTAVIGGAGLMYIGLPIASLAEILPLRASNIRSQYQGLFRFVPAAGVYSAFQVPEAEISQIPPVDYYYLTSNNAAETIAGMDNPQKSPAISYLKTSGGKVIGYSFLNLWRWQMQSATGSYRSFISNQLVWLSNKDNGLFAPIYQPGYFMGDPVQIRLSASDETHKASSALSPRLTVTDEKGKAVYSDFMAQDKEQYLLNLRLPEPGKYSFTISDAATGKKTGGSFIVYPQNREDRDRGYNLPLLGWLASQTGGRFMNLTEAAGYSPFKAVRTEHIQKIDFPLYKKWYLITLFLLSFCLELFLRRRWGLL